MSLDKNYIVLDDALKIARQYYDDKTFERAVYTRRSCRSSKIH